MEYKQEDFLMLSGIQHFKFCRRQWALIHIEHQWAENLRTVDGALLHKNAHDISFHEKRGDTIITRGMRVFSPTLGVSGECDVLEFQKDVQGITLDGQEGTWRAYPIEYKKGKPNTEAGDTLQLCGQAMCLEEMLCCEIPCGALYYGEIKRRQSVEFTKELRDEVRAYLAEMHMLFARGHTPKVKRSKSCNACSLKEICVPKLMNRRPVADYLQAGMEDAL